MIDLEFRSPIRFDHVSIALTTRKLLYHARFFQFSAISEVSISGARSSLFRSPFARLSHGVRENSYSDKTRWGRPIFILFFFSSERCRNVEEFEGEECTVGFLGMSWRRKRHLRQSFIAITERSSYFHWRSRSRGAQFIWISLGSGYSFPHLGFSIFFAVFYFSFNYASLVFQFTSDICSANQFLKRVR